MRRPSVSTVVCVILIVLLLPIFVINMTLVIKGMLDDSKPPSIFGVIPLAVLSGSMDDGSEDCIRKGDMIFIRETPAKELAVGDIVTFSIGDEFVTHRIVELVYEGDTLTGIITKGDANNTTDGTIPIEDVCGRYFQRVGNLGNVAIFLQTPLGIVIVVGIPVLAYIAVDLVQRQLRHSKDQTLREKDAEIERLRALVKTGELAQSDPQAEQTAADAQKDAPPSESEDGVEIK